jgi:peptidoglycan/xylan/chitin deacetylase (PgdA/CDA1 family)
MKTRLRKRFEFLVGVYGPSVARLAVPSLIWRVDTNGAPVVYLTFDDGPTPHLTPRLLDALARYEVTATFFLLGKHVALDPSLVGRIEDAGHRIGLHGYDHLDAWNTDSRIVQHDLDRGLDLLSSVATNGIRYFRPPFGRFRRSTMDWARERGLSIVMWDVMPGDFISDTPPSLMISRVRRRVRSGSIIVMHDSWNPNVVMHTLVTLEEMLSALRNGGWRFERL